MRARNIRWWGLLTAGAVMLVASAGCIFSPDDDPEDNGRPPPANYVFPDTEDKLIDNFKEAYSRMEIDKYREIIHTDYKFFFTEFDINTLGLASDHYNRDEDLEVATNMFSGDPLPDPQGGDTPIPGISDISWSLLQQTVAWGQSFDPRFPGARRALYEFELSITRPGANTIAVSGEQEFFVISRDSTMSDGTTKKYYQLVGQVDRSLTGEDG